MNRKIYLKKVLGTALCLSMGLGVLAACSPQSTPTDQSASSKDGQTLSNQSDAPVDIELLTWHGPDKPTKFYAGYEAMAKEYMDLHPNVTITIKSEDESTYGSILETGFAGGEAPDIMQMQSAQRLTFAPNLLNLRAYLNEENPYDTRNPKWIDNFVGGEAMFPPENNNADADAFLFVPNDGNPNVSTGQLYIFNKDIIAKAGLDPEKTPVTWKEMFLWLEALNKNRDQVEPIAGSNDVGGKISQVGNEFGEKYADKFFGDEINNPDFSADLFYDKLYVLTCYQGGSTMPLDNLPYYPALFALMKQHLSYYQTSWPENTPETESLTFASGKAAMMVTSYWDYNKLTGNLSEGKFPQGYGLFPVPYMGKETLDYATEQGWISKDEAEAAKPYAVDRVSASDGAGKHEYGFTVNKALESEPEKLAAVIDFLKFMSSKDSQVKYVEMAQSLSPVVDVAIPESLQAFVVEEPKDGFAKEILGITVIEWGKSGWDIEMMKFLKGEAEWQGTVDAISHPEWVNDIPPLADLEAAVPTAQTELEAADETTKTDKERALAFAELRLTLYRDYFFNLTGDLKVRE